MKCETCGQQIEEPRQNLDETCVSCKRNLTRMSEEDGSTCRACIKASNHIRPYPNWTPVV